MSNEWLVTSCCQNHTRLQNADFFRADIRRLLGSANAMRTTLAWTVDLSAVAVDWLKAAAVTSLIAVASGHHCSHGCSHHTLRLRMFHSNRSIQHFSDASDVFVAETALNRKFHLVSSQNNLKWTKTRKFKRNRQRSHLRSCRTSCWDYCDKHNRSTCDGPSPCSTSTSYTNLRTGSGDCCPTCLH